MTDAVAVGFGGNPQSLSPAGTGFTYYFTDDPPAQPRAESDQDSLRRFLASPNNSGKRVDNGFRALGFTDPNDPAGPPPRRSAAALAAPAPHNWLAWFTVRGTDFSRSTVGNDLKCNQIDGIAGLTWRLRPDFVVGVLGGYERFDYSSQAFNGTLKGDGWTVGTYLGWRLSPNIRFDAGAAWAAIMANDTAGTAKGSFTGTHWLASAGLTGIYPWEGFVFEPSARVFTLWEREKASPIVLARCNQRTISKPAARAAASRQSIRSPGRVRWRCRPMPESMPTIISHATTHRPRPRPPHSPRCRSYKADRRAQPAASRRPSRVARRLVPAVNSAASAASITSGPGPRAATFRSDTDALAPSFSLAGRRSG
jgi:hypothetical protein